MRASLAGRVVLGPEGLRLAALRIDGEELSGPAWDAVLQDALASPDYVTYYDVTRRGWMDLTLDEDGLRADMVYVDDGVKDYIVRLVHMTRYPDEVNPALTSMIRSGSSPRGGSHRRRASRRARSSASAARHRRANASPWASSAPARWRTTTISGRC